MSRFLANDRRAEEREIRELAVRGFSASYISDYLGIDYNETLRRMRRYRRREGKKLKGVMDVDDWEGAEYWKPKKK